MQSSNTCTVHVSGKAQSEVLHILFVGAECALDSRTFRFPRVHIEGAKSLGQLQRLLDALDELFLVLWRPQLITQMWRNVFMRCCLKRTFSREQSDLAFPVFFMQAMLHVWIITNVESYRLGARNLDPFASFAQKEWVKWGKHQSRCPTPNYVGDIWMRGTRFCSWSNCPLCTYNT
jgi:hypothetical protein